MPLQSPQPNKTPLQKSPDRATIYAPTPADSGNLRPAPQNSQSSTLRATASARQTTDATPTPAPTSKPNNSCKEKLTIKSSSSQSINYQTSHPSMCNLCADIGSLPTTKKATTPFRDSRSSDSHKGRRLFYCINNCLECLRLVHCQVSQNLAVHSDTLSIVLAHKL